MPRTERDLIALKHGGSIKAIDIIRSMLLYIGDDPDRPGLKDTPKRIVKSWDEMFSGYKDKPENFMTVFDDIPQQEMIVLKGIEFVSFCEHHWLPFHGVAHIGYIPFQNKIVGISKLARLLDLYSKRLQVQERITASITEAIETYLQPCGAACVIEAKHLCMCARGVKKQNSVMVTTDMRGCFKSDAACRSEFYSLIK